MKNAPLRGRAGLEGEEANVVEAGVAGVEVDVGFVGAAVICSNAFVGDGIREVFNMVDGDVETDALNGLMVESRDADGVASFGVGRTAFTDKNEMTVHGELLLFIDCI